MNPPSPPEIEPAPPPPRSRFLDFGRGFGLFLSGFSTFGMLYCVQAMLPAFSEEFGISPATSSLALSVATLSLAPMLLVASPVSEALGRKGIIVVSLAVSALLTVAAAWAPSFAMLLVLRMLAGIALAGVPSVVMAYLGEEIGLRSIGLASGLLIAGNALGGMTGRLGSGIITDHQGWRTAIAVMGGWGLVVAALVWLMLPASRNFHPRPLHIRTLGSAFSTHLANPQLRRLYALAFLFMSSFVIVYNYAGYRLLAAPFSLSHSVIGAIFSLYLVGMVTSIAAGQIVDRIGRRRTLLAAIVILLAGALLTLPDNLPMIIGGVTLVTIGFFAAHTVASSWVARNATIAKAQASALYLFSCYVGSSLVAWGGGYAWSGFGWNGVVVILCLMGTFALLLARQLAHEPGPPPPSSPG